ncbi:MAG: UMP kinase [Hadesarchaea archaeon]|nr:MAG: UMP kinase [Hadesarchaea archaeon]
MFNLCLFILKMLQRHVRITLNFGGSVLSPHWPDVENLKLVAKVVRELVERKHEVLVVVGGGEPARKYIQAGRELGGTEVLLHELGIEITRLNARLLAMALGDLSEPSPPTTFREASQLMLRGKVPVMGGTVPGHTTDAVAAMAAKATNSSLLLFVTDVDGVYTSDPKLDPTAKKLDRIGTEELLELVGTKVSPGMRTILDPVAVKLLQQLRIRTLVIGKKEIPRIPLIVEGGEHSGTEILTG